MHFALKIPSKCLIGPRFKFRLEGIYSSSPHCSWIGSYVRCVTFLCGGRCQPNTIESRTVSDYKHIPFIVSIRFGHLHLHALLLSATKHRTPPCSAKYNNKSSIITEVFCIVLQRIRAFLTAASSVGISYTNASLLHTLHVIYNKIFDHLQQNMIFFDLFFFYSVLQIQDAKDLHHLSLVGSYGAHLLHSFPPHFLHPSANAGGSPFSSGGAFVKPFPSNLPLPSAFAPPSKCVGLGLEQVNTQRIYSIFF